MDASGCSYTSTPAPREARGGISGWWLVGGAAVVLLLMNARHRRLEEESAAPAEATPAELLRGLLVTIPRTNRGALLKRYQKAEGLTPSGRWDVATSAAAEKRLSDFSAPAREGLARVLERDTFFRAQGGETS